MPSQPRLEFANPEIPNGAIRPIGGCQAEKEVRACPCNAPSPRLDASGTFHHPMVRGVECIQIFRADAGLDSDLFLGESLA